ncbi:MAG: tetratricopeptide repeat protein [Marinifilaceae bacterium]
MKKLFLITILITGNLLAGLAQNQYEKGMQQALQLWQSQKPMEAIGLFERIASAEKENWLPNYYVGLVLTTQVFSNRDKSQAEAMLTKAQKHLDIAQKKSPKNSELLCLQGFINTAKITLDPMTNGQKLSQATIETYKKAIQLDPNNPRALYLLAEFQINMAKFFGSDTTEYYEMIIKSLEKFNTFKAPEAFYPNWGAERAKQILANRNGN